MLIAYNNDIEFRSRWYHIQTEDNGLKDGHITTTVFHSGQILDSKTTSYKDAIAGVTDTEEQNRIIKDMMVKQHQMFYTKLYEGNYEAQMQALGTRASGASQSSIPKSVSHTGSPVPGASHMDNSTAQMGSLKKPDILRASQQQAPGLSKMGLKSLSGINSGKSLGSSVPFGLSNRGPSPKTASSSQPPVGDNSKRVASPAQPIVISKAVAAEKNRRKRMAWSGFAWPADDLAIDVLVVSLLDGK